MEALKQIPAMADPAAIPLRDYLLPKEVGWWPPAPGWWGLLGLSLLLVTIAALVVRRYRRQQWRRDARELLAALAHSYEQEQDAHGLARGVSIFLRRVCLSRFADQAGAELGGEEWLCLLDKMRRPRRQRTALWGTPLGRQLLAAAYNPRAELEGELLLSACRQWLAALPPRPWRKP
ncbi:DUF4381 domain-containing protein [Desulfogranum mediterraneum]|uniref:DUF4381 domain-containing protein n=1 Tax=Desulfogranum mediterraneum TaxID=160661 RepID=UPI0004125A05|nr:DUF4381 domain-containing protein [Desulfogranum mediterraneum]